MNIETKTTYFIRNDWDDRTFCALDNSWVNDGRESANFETKELAESALEQVPSEDRDRCHVDSYEYEVE